MPENMELMDRFSKINVLLHYNYHKQRKAIPGDTCRGQNCVLSVLMAHPEISQKELSSMLDIRSQSLGELLIKLDRNGYIDRSLACTDRRGMDIRLTPKGFDMTNRLKDCLVVSVSFFDCLDDNDEHKLNDFLDRMILETYSFYGFAAFFLVISAVLGILSFFNAETQNAE
jgi:DNA-binding MarR family transcriptional regulator